MKKIISRRIAICLVFCLILELMPVPSGDSRARAATFSEVNQDEVFLKQPGGSNLCTLVAAAMLVRRAAMMNGNENWAAISTDVMRSAAWVEGTGLKWNFNCSGITVAHDSFSGSEDVLLTKLSEHPEGVVVYKQKSDQQHAVLVTDYTDGMFYCADPSGAVPAGRIPMDSASISVDECNYIWYVTSPTLYLTDDSGSAIAHEVETPAPTLTPTATPSPTPTASPKATAKASSAPKATSSPKETAKATSKPKATKEPEETTSSSDEKVTAPGKVAEVRVTNNKKKTLTITWSKVAGAKGYQVRFGHQKKLKGSASVSLSGRRAMLTDLSKGSVYYVKVRAYKQQNKKKVYGSYSTVKKGKVKK